MMILKSAKQHKKEVDKMPKQRKTDEQRLKEKRGLGRGIHYVPWIKAHEMASNGRKHRIMGIKCKRIFHFLSDLEYYFYWLQFFDDRVIEIREQFPLLTLETTKLLARELNIEHPSADGKDRVMTTDFVLTVRKNNIFTDIVRTVKPSEKITKRTLEKFRLEEEYFVRKYEDNDFDWGVVTEKEINITKALNISNLANCYDWNLQKGVNGNRLKGIISFFRNSLEKNGFDVEVTISHISEIFNYSKSEVFDLIKFLIIRKEIKVNLEDKLIKDLRYIKIDL